MNGAKVLIDALEREGVDVVFGYPGGAIMPVYDALYGAKVKHVLVRHEQAAVLAADGYARVSGRVGVCLATSGPGATNLVTGIANAHLDSIPLVAITGQVPTSALGTDAFQEVDIIGITLPIVKHSFLVRSAAELPATVCEAFDLARSGRPGPVLIDLPKDVASEEVAASPARHCRRHDLPAPDSRKLERALGLMKSSRRPVIYAGGGIVLAQAVDVFRRFAATTGAPVVTTLKGIGVLRTEDEQNLGMIGMHGSAAANHAVQGSDLLIAVGVRFDDRATGKLSEFAPHAKVIHLDIDGAEVGKRRAPEVGLVGAIEPALDHLAVRLDIDPWQRMCTREAWSYEPPTDGVYGPRLLKKLTEAAGEHFTVCCDVGQHQMWVAQHGRFTQPEQHLTSGGLGTMGYGLPAAIGAHFADPARQVINVTGDGSIMMNFQELVTVARYRLPIKIVVMDNQSLGLVRQWQELFFDERYSEVDLSDNPDFVRVAESLGIAGATLERGSDEDDAVEALLAATEARILHVRIDRKANVWPLVPPNRANDDMLVGAHR